MLKGAHSSVPFGLVLPRSLLCDRFWVEDWVLFIWWKQPGGLRPIGCIFLPLLLLIPRGSLTTFRVVRVLRTSGVGWHSFGHGYLVISEEEFTQRRVSLPLSIISSMYTFENFLWH